ncbi:hypothetical protein BGZ46_010667 [Entomortierella lignicola]|nr:hypothetical protein BGZ46_010667 [Entomortierella lignicola]
MAPLNSLEIPHEIVFTIFEYLSRPQIVDCLLVCKDWHKLLLHLIWESVIVHHDFLRSYPLHKYISYHRHLITKLGIIPSPSEFPGFILTYPNLHTLELLIQWRQPNEQYEQHVADIIKLNPTVVNLELWFKGISNKNGLMQFWIAVSNLPNLKTLKVCSMELDYDEIELFWDVCKKLRELRLDSPKRFNRDIKKQDNIIFPQMKYMSFDFSGHMRGMIQLEYIRRSQQIEELEWDLGFEETADVLEEFVSDVERGLWPRLEKLEIYHCYADTLTKRIIDGLQRITKLCRPGIQFGPLSFQALQRHFSYLSKLDLQECLGETSAMLLEALSSCPSLQSLKGLFIRANDIVESKPWVCLSIRRLEVRIEFGELDQMLQPLVFKRLSVLTRLETLEIGDGWSRKIPPYHDRLDLRLASGLGHLSSLRLLKSMDITFSRQSMEEADIRWMLTNWSRLESVGCELNNRDAIVNNRLCDILLNVYDRTYACLEDHESAFRHRHITKSDIRSPTPVLSEFVMTYPNQHTFKVLDYWRTSNKHHEFYVTELANTRHDSRQRQDRVVLRCLQEAKGDFPTESKMGL